MVGVFVFLESDDVKLGDGIYLFSDKHKAVEWQVSMLVKWGQAVPVEGGYTLPVTEDRPYDLSRPLTAAEVVKAWQEGLGALEFFHVYDVHE
jgi:hypothetical protein